MELYVCVWYSSKGQCFPFKLTQISTWFQITDTNCLEIKKIYWDGSDVKFKKKSKMFKCYRHKGMIEGKFRGNSQFCTNPQSFILSGFTKIDACGTAFFLFIYFFFKRSVTFRSAFGNHEADWRGLEDAGRSLALCWPFFHWWCTSQQSFSCTRLAYTTGFTMKVCHSYEWPPSHRQPNRKTNNFLSPTVDFCSHD